MKRTFYDLLGVPRDVKQEQLDAAYEQQARWLNAANLRGGSEIVVDSKLLREGYQILSDPAQRAKYDAKLAAAKSGVELLFFPEWSAAYRKGVVEAFVLVVLMTVLGGVMYYQVSRKVDQVRIEHTQAYLHQQEENMKVRSFDAKISTGADTSAALDEQKSGIAGQR